MNLAEFLDCATFEGSILVKAWNEAEEEYTLEKFTDELLRRDVWIYSWLVKYVYPIDYYRNNHHTPVVVIEVWR